MPGRQAPILSSKPPTAGAGEVHLLAPECPGFFLWLDLSPGKHQPRAHHEYGDQGPKHHIICDGHGMVHRVMCP